MERMFSWPGRIGTFAPSSMISRVSGPESVTSGSSRPRIADGMSESSASRSSRVRTSGLAIQLAGLGRRAGEGPRWSMTGFGADARGGVKGSAPIRRTAKVGHTTPHLQLTLEPCSRAMPGGCRRGGGLAQAQEGAKVVGELGVGEFTCGVLELYSAEGAATPITKCIRVSIGGVDGKYSIWEGLCVGGKRH